jgi:hypothetical protein
VSAFDRVRHIGLTLPGVDADIRYDGSPRLKVGGCFMAAMAAHATAEPDSLVVRTTIEDRELLLQDAPDTYYLTDHYRRHPVVLVRLAAIDSEALRDILTLSRRLTLPKVRRSRTRPT